MVDNKETIQRQQDLKELRENRVLQEVLSQVRTRVQTKRKEQRSALLQSDSMKVFRLEGEIAGVEETLRIYDAQMADKKEIPTINY